MKSSKPRVIKIVKKFDEEFYLRLVESHDGGCGSFSALGGCDCDHGIVWREIQDFITKAPKFHKALKNISNSFNVFR